MTIFFVWTVDQRPYDVRAAMGPPTRAPADLTCDRWTSGRGLSGKIQRGEDTRIIAQKRMEGVVWIRIARTAGGACWMDRYHWDEAVGRVGRPWTSARRYGAPRATTFEQP